MDTASPVDVISGQDILIEAATLSDRLATMRQEQMYESDKAFPSDEFCLLREADFLKITHRKLTTTK